MGPQLSHYLWICITIQGLANTISCTKLYGYDCSKQGVTTKAINLVDVAECPPISPASVTTSPVYGQVLQLSATTHGYVKACQIFRTTSIYRCGMHSHQMLIDGPFFNDPYQITPHTCLDIHQYHEWKITADFTMSNLRVNHTTAITITEHGTLSLDGSCTGSSFSNQGKEYTHAFSRVTYQIRLTEFITTIDTQSNLIHLQDGLTCIHDQESCFDSIVGVSVWKAFKSDCDLLNPYLLYEGNIDLSKNDYGGLQLMRVKSTKFLFMSILQHPTRVCGRKLHSTDFQNIYVLIIEGYNPKLEISGPISTVINPVLYANAKLSYLHYQTVQDLNNIYLDIIQRLCTMHREVIQNKLNILRLAGYSASTMDGLGARGTIVSVQGEVAYVSTCPIAEITIRSTDHCYHGIPVTSNQTTAFLTPISRLIVPTVDQIPCDIVTPSMYKIQDHWVALTPHPTIVKDPIMLQPTIAPISLIKPSQEFIHGGLYSQKAIKSFYDSITFPQSRTAILNDVARSVTANTPSRYDIVGTINDGGWDTIAKRNLTTIWGKFLVFGEVMSGLFGIYIIYSLICKFLGVLTRGWALHKLYGCTWKIIGALWSATTFLATTKRAHKDIPKAEQEECDEIVIS